MALGAVGAALACHWAVVPAKAPRASACPSEKPKATHTPGDGVLVARDLAVSAVASEAGRAAEALAGVAGAAREALRWDALAAESVLGLSHLALPARLSSPEDAPVLRG